MKIFIFDTDTVVNPKITRQRVALMYASLKSLLEMVNKIRSKSHTRIYSLSLMFNSPQIMENSSKVN